MTEPEGLRQVLSTAPVFGVRDVQSSADYYRDVLGFAYERLWGDPPCFCMPTRDGFIFMLKQPSDANQIHPNSEVDGETWDAYVYVKDVDRLFAEFSSNGASFVYEPQIRDYYQMKEFAVRDPDGHVIAFGQDWPAL